MDHHTPKRRPTSQRPKNGYIVYAFALLMALLAIGAACASSLLFPVTADDDYCGREDCESEE